MTAHGPRWAVHRATGPAGTFHQRPLEGRLGRAVHVWQVERSALVLGSTQPDELADRAACEAAGVDVVRRRSGGGAVLLDPGEVVWVDLELPRGDPLWDDDVGRAAWWVGDRWAAALAALGVVHATAHHGPMRASRWSRVACFAGLGPGEVTAGAGGPKVVGVAQRRTRAGARFQCAVPVAWRPERLAGLLRLPGPDERDQRDDLVAELGTAVRPVAAPGAEVVAALLERL